jgi:hypothetical protein
MGKNSQQRREDKKKLKAKRAKRIGQKEKPNFNRPVLTKLDIPSPFGELHGEALSKKLDEVGSKSRQGVMEHIGALNKIFLHYDPLILLAILSGYCLTTSAGADGVEREDSKLGITQFHLELMQSLTLQIPYEEWGVELPMPEIVDSARKILEKLGHAITFSRLNGSSIGGSEKNIAAKQLQHQLQLNTQAIRNWGYYQEVLSISTEIYSYFDKPLQERFGFTASSIIAVFNHLLRTSERAQNQRFQHLSDLRQTRSKRILIEKYYRMSGQKNIEAFLESSKFGMASIDQLFFMILSHMDLKMPEMFTFDVIDVANALKISIDSVNAIFSELSYSPGELADQKTEFIFLDNPVWHKPAIKMDDGRYFCCIPQLFFSFVLPTLDAIVAKVNKPKLHLRRANYLEQKIEEIVKRRFPEVSTVAGIKWHYENKLFETDLLTFIDSHIILIEAKSHSVTKPALRGATDRLRRHINELIVEPSVQSNRLEKRLNELINDPTIEDELREKLPVDLSRIHQVTRVSITLENFASLQTNLAKIADAGWLPADFKACPTITLADFEILFDLLEHPVQIIHYLQRRTELEGKFNFVGDELDLLGLYQTTFLDLGNIQVDEDSLFNLTGLSAPIDKYYMSKGEGIQTPKPKPKISPLFDSVFQMLESRSIPRWTEIGVILNRFPPEEQLKITDQVKRQTKVVRKKWKEDGHKNIVICHPPRSSSYSLAWVLITNENLDKRDYFIEQASFLGLEQSHVKTCLIISTNIDTPEEAYNFIGLFER